MMAAAMLPFAFGMALDIFIIAESILDHPMKSSATATAALLAFIGLWFVMPAVARMRSRRRAQSAHI
jgi:hypothetical protein